MEMAKAKTHRRCWSLVNTLPFNAPQTPPRNRGPVDGREPAEPWLRSSSNR
jgi:hypothetical protein